MSDGSSELDGFTVQVHRGAGLVARSPQALLVILDRIETVGRVTDLLLELCAGLDGGERLAGRRLVRRLAGILAQEEPDDVPAFAVLTPTASGLAALVHGAAELTASAAEEIVLRGATSATWVDRLIPGTIARIVVRADGSKDEPDDARLDLRSGVVPGSGVTLVLAGVPAMPTPSPGERDEDSAAAEPAAEGARTVEAGGPAGDAKPDQTPPPLTPLKVPADEPTNTGPDPGETAGYFESVTLVSLDSEEPDDAREPLPTVDAPAEEDGAALVRGVVCSRGHFNSPTTLFCSVCGISMVQRTHDYVFARRPPVGVVVLDDGATYVLRTDYIVGREPEGDEAVKSGRALPLVITDDESTISRVHAELRLVEWELHVVDRGSANGTYVAASGTTSWTPLVPNEPTVIAPGTRVQVGTRTFVFDSHHRA